MIPRGTTPIPKIIRPIIKPTNPKELNVTAAPSTHVVTPNTHDEKKIAMPATVRVPLNNASGRNINRFRAKTITAIGYTIK